MIASSPKRVPPADRVAYLDGLRAIAALMVFVGHSAGAGLLPLPSPMRDWIISHGPYGVTIFFVLSAYTLCMSVAPRWKAAPCRGEPISSADSALRAR